MTDPLAGETEFIEDAEFHNPWWEGIGHPLTDLEAVSDLMPRSDVLECVKSIDGKQRDGIERLIYPIYGPTGIGKTTLLLQTIAALLPHSAIEFSPGHRDFDIVGAIEPRQILYVPLEDSLYHLERSADAVDALQQVVAYFRSHIAPRNEREFILLDDIGALRLDGQDERVLVDLLGDETYLLLTGILESQVDLKGIADDDGLAIEDAWAMLPMKFADAVQQGVYRQYFGDEFGGRIESYRTTSMDGDSFIDVVRDSLTAKKDIEAAIDALDQLYFDALPQPDRDGLHEAARDYLRTGGLLHRVQDSMTRNELVKSNFLLYLYKELARFESIQRPENLHRISSLAASRAGEELRYTDISEQLEVDRRTMDAYLDVLDDGLSVSESHDFALQRHRRTRLFLRNPRHVVLLSQRQEHYGFEEYDRTRTLNPEFEYKLARTVAFDHAARLAFSVGSDTDGTPHVEYAETDAGTVEYILHDDGFVLPFVLSYQPYAGDPEAIATAFDPAVGKHAKPDGEELRDLDYVAPVRFVVTDSVPQSVTEAGSLRVDREGVTVCYLPFWLFLLIC